MDHQNWETYIIHCKESNKNTSKENNGKHKDVSKAVKLEKMVDEDKLSHKHISKDVANLIKNKRCEMKLKQKDLAKQLNVNVSLINDIEMGKAIHNGKLIAQIKRKLNLK